MNILVIHELDYSDNNKMVIGVSDSFVNAKSLIKEYYGDYRQVSFTDVRDSNIECVIVIETDGYKVKLTLEWFTINMV